MTPDESSDDEERRMLEAAEIKNRALLEKMRAMDVQIKITEQSETSENHLFVKPSSSRRKPTSSSVWDGSSANGRRITDS
jgi:hypothetical protein